MRKKTQYSPPATLRVAMRAGNTPPLHHSSSPIRIISGGQTGADRAALDWALAHGVSCGGWCPKGRKAEDGPIDAKYPLKETPSASYLQRTEWNARDSDATVLFSIEPTLTGGSKKTVEFARKHRKPWFHLCAGEKSSVEKLRAFVEEHRVKVLNVAGPRASKEPKVWEFVIRTLDEAFS
jgi:Circularly permutated YpsA SLOG family